MKMPTMNMSRTPDAKLTSLNNAGRISGWRASDPWTRNRAESHASEDGLGDDLVRGEPVLVLAVVQHQLQAADPDRQHAEAKPVEAQTLLRAAARQEDHQAGGGEQTERQVDVEDVAPTVGLGEPAADRRTHDRAEHHPDPPNRHGEASPLKGIDVEQRGLGQWHQGCAERAPEARGTRQSGSATGPHRRASR